MPLANAFIKDPDEIANEQFYPLNVVWCEKCALLMIDEVVPPEIMFSNYLYVSGTSPTLNQHFLELTEKAIQLTNLQAEDLVIDIASNDGTLLKHFKNRDFRILGIEPAKNLADQANSEGIPTENDFIKFELAKSVAERYGRAKIITATNVVAHINDLNELMRSVSELITDDGVFIIEVPYLVDLINNTEFDTIYHEHLSYFSFHPLNYLFKKYNYKVIDIERIDIHGGSIRVYVTQQNSDYEVSPHVEQMLQFEKKLKITELSFYKTFAKKVEDLKANLIQALSALKENDKSIAGYGASAKGNTLLNYFEINTSMIDYIADLNPLKQGYLTPGTHIPVVDPTKIIEQKPDYLLLLAWNFKDEIMEQQQQIREWDGKFIIPIPDVEII
jgi:SAM-dependent methyltransferase